MVKVVIKDEHFNAIELQFYDCVTAGKFMDVVLAAAIEKVSYEVDVVPEPVPTEEPQVEPAEVPTEEPQVELTPEPQEEAVETF